jgi:hypothetical protein
MFDDADPLLGRVRMLALAFPDAAEKISHGRPAFFATKVFAYYGGSVKIDGVYMQHEHSVLVFVETEERAALLRDAGALARRGTAAATIVRSRASRSRGQSGSVVTSYP